jgi:hypothetical protein
MNPETQVYRIIDKISRLFSKSSTDIGLADIIILIQHKINTGTALPIRQHILGIFI